MQGLRNASFVNNGQTCHLSSRILAPRSRYDEIVDAVAALADGMAVGDPWIRRTEIGPMVSARQRDRVLGYIDIGKDSDARFGGRRIGSEDQPRGWFVSPTVFADVTTPIALAREEIFGPVLTITSYDTDDEAIALANDTEFGLAGTVWSADVDRATDGRAGRAHRHDRGQCLRA